jgi:hypothetical protein
MRVELFAPKDWRDFSENAHSIVFEKHKPASWDRIDHAMLVVRDEDPVGYITAREVDAETVYWQFGGMFPKYRDGVNTMKAYKLCIDLAALRYKRISTLIENTNTAMLRIAMHQGFRIIGVRAVGGSVLVEHLLEFKQGEGGEREPITRAG